MSPICPPNNENWYYNRSRPHSGKYCYPMQTFFDSMHIAYQKNIDSIKQDADFGFDFVNSSVS